MDYQNYDKLNLTYQYSNDEVSISFKRKLINTHNIFGDERHLNDFFVDMKLSNGDIFPDGFYITDNPQITYSSKDPNPDYRVSLSEEDIKKYKYSSIDVEEIIYANTFMGYYKIVGASQNVAINQFFLDMVF